MPNLLNFKLTIEDLMGPKVVGLIQQMALLGSKVTQPHKLHVNSHEAQSGLEKVTHTLEKLGIAFGIFEAVDFLKESVSKFNEAEQAVGQLEASLRSTRGVVGLTKDEMIGMSTALMGKSLFEEKAITQAQSVLLTFTNIKGAIYKDAVPAIVDLATKMGGDLQGATVQVGKALNDPIKGITALQRVGVSFSASQKETIKKLVETGHTAQAQAIIIKELGTEFGGSADAASKAGTGGLTVLKNKFDAVRESMGGLAADGIKRLYPSLLTGIHGFERMIEVIRATPAFVEEYKIGLYSIGVALLALNASTIVSTIVQGGLTAAINLSKLALWALDAAAAANPLGIMIAAAAILIGVFVHLYQKTEGVRGAIDGLVAGGKSAFMDLAQAAVKILGGVGKLIHGIFTLDKNEIAKGLRETVDGLAAAAPSRIAMRAGIAGTVAYDKGVAAVRAEKAAAKPHATDEFLSGKPSKPTSMTAAASTAKTGGGVDGSDHRVMNINLRIDTLMREVKLSGATMGESVKDLAALIRDTVIAELNDVNTLASTN